MEKANDAGITIVRIFDAPRELVWNVWTDPQHVTKWWGPAGFTSPGCKADFRVGGKYFYCMRGPAGTEFDKDMWSGGEYREIVPMEKIVVTDNFADAEGNYVSPAQYGMPGEWPEELIVTVTFEDAGPGKTKLTLHHVGNPKELESMTQEGWQGSLDKFAAALR